LWNNRYQEQNIFWQLIRFTITGNCVTTLNCTVFYISLTLLDFYYAYASITGAISGMILARCGVLMIEPEVIQKHQNMIVLDLNFMVCSFLVSF
jgi:hypothetical protein|tara:strand:- start:2089 stop:2370 length:282 start_codon:yes stop_codon:yes gene_type:complete